eukprot:c18994_g1_i5.p1 GENE.c18994_g1_i5~~c18994_g1_i5.p1  ORF type:complete len:236 (+),score=57.35 c18994_g1_i5:39-710(+)
MSLSRFSRVAPWYERPTNPLEGLNTIEFRQQLAELEMKLAKDREAGDAAALEATRQELLSVYNRYKILWVPLVQRWQFLLDSPSTWRQCTTETERALQLASEQAIPNPFELRVLGKVYEFDVKELTQRINNGSRKLRVQPLDAVLTEADFRTESKIDEAKLFMRYLSTKLDLPEDSEPVIAQFKIGFGLRSEDDAKKVCEQIKSLLSLQPSFAISFVLFRIRF